tara:strand:+ start:290 stop:544 length:255 start_codon:yes stop_codon:yes gene_type:complete
MNKLENLKKKIIYRSSYRGTKEMDILLSSFVKKYLDKLNEKELYELEKILDLDDETINNFYQNNVIDQKLRESKILNMLKKFKI